MLIDDVGTSMFTSQTHILFSACVLCCAFLLISLYVLRRLFWSTFFIQHQIAKKTCLHLLLFVYEKFILKLPKKVGVYHYGYPFRRHCFCCFKMNWLCDLFLSRASEHTFRSLFDAVMFRKAEMFESISPIHSAHF